MVNQGDIQEFERLLAAGWPELSAETREKIGFFRCLVLEESKKQNLTKLLNSKDFFDGHVLDVKALLSSNLCKYPAVDLGSGVGVPGLLSGLVSGDLWILSESERRKADFLINTVEKLDLKNIQVRAERAEVVLRSENCNSVVSRAVGKVNKIYSLLRGCSTWNNLVLFKGPGWTEEWDQFRKDRRAKELELTESYPYEVGSSAKRRLIIRLDRVPRGTVR